MATARPSRGSWSALATLALVLTFACAGPGPDSPVDAGRGLSEAGVPDLAAAIRAQERHTPGLMARSGIVGTAVGLTPGGRPVIRIFLVHGNVTGVPARLDDVPVERVVTGLFTLDSDPTSRARPAPVGFSIGHPDITAGTLGARVVDASGQVYILSNNHVIANSNNASIGDPILQPGPYDGGTSADSLAWLFDFQPISFSSNNTMDAGVARTVAGNVDFATPTEDAYGAPSSQVFGDGNGDGFFDDMSQLLGLNVMKYGRTTGFTTGPISEINLTVSVCYVTRGPFMCAQAATFVDQIAIGSGSFSAGGDSGSLIVSQSGKNPVGLLFAGSDTRTIANRIDLVLDRFGVTVDDGSGGGGDPGNASPVATFTFTCTELACDFDGTGSSDSDGTIASWAWDFGDATTGSGSTVSHTYAAAGTYTVTLTVTDDDGATDSDGQSVSVTGGDAGGGTTMHVGDLDASSVNNGSSWTGHVTIRVHGSGHGAVEGAAVSGSWSSGATGTASCTTDSTGACTVSNSGIPKRNSSAVFSVTGASHSSLTYDSGANHDPDGDSSGTSITVLKP